MRRFYCGFPSGRAGYGLLILRVGLGLHLIASAVDAATSATSSRSVMETTAVASTQLLAGVSSLLGVLTPIGQSLAALAEIVRLGDSPVVVMSAMHGAGWLPGATLVTAIGLAMLGPGAYSVDARFFGRRSITIRPKSSSR
ncbi:MAG: hypothetical protein K2Y23_03640 [Cyanobacteria bacterium]|nr:hypothetical protein [Cyanobacteriota bacterium]